MAGFDNTSNRWDSQTHSLRVGSVWGIRVRIHLVAVLVAAVLVVMGFQAGGFEFVGKITLPVLCILLVLVLVHEFGHCFGCRSVGGQADDILIWPLGGLASCSPPHRPFDHFITAIAGPLTNLCILLLLLPISVALGTLTWSMWNPLATDIPAPPETVGFYVAILWRLNLLLLAFNVLLPMFPLDGGRILQTALWARDAYHPAMVITTTVGMVGGVVLTALGLYVAGRVTNDYLLLCAIGLFCFVESLRIRREIEAMGDLGDGEFGYDFSQGYTSLERSTPRTRPPVVRMLLGNYLSWLERRRYRQSVRLEAELDRILEKIHQNGMESLSRAERRILVQASKRRHRD